MTVCLTHKADLIPETVGAKKLPETRTIIDLRVSGLTGSSISFENFWYFCGNG
jgi:hypothetical protein